MTYKQGDRVMIRLKLGLFYGNVKGVSKIPGMVRVKRDRISSLVNVPEENVKLVVK